MGTLNPTPHCYFFVKKLFRKKNPVRNPIRQAFHIYALFDSYAEFSLSFVFFGVSIDYLRSEYFRSLRKTHQQKLTHYCGQAKTFQHKFGQYLL